MSGGIVFANNPGLGLGLNLRSSLGTLGGPALAFLFLREIQAGIPYIMALSATSVIYIATVDQRHKRSVARCSCGASTRTLQKLSGASSSRNRRPGSGQGETFSGYPDQIRQEG
jgi:hypothetical protein